MALARESIALKAIAAWNEGYRIIGNKLNMGLELHELHIECDPVQPTDCLEHARRTLLDCLHRLRSATTRDLDSKLLDLEINLEDECPWLLGYLFDPLEVIVVSLKSADTTPEPFEVYIQNIQTGRWPAGWKKRDFKSRIVNPIVENRKVWLDFLKELDRENEFGVSIRDIGIAFDLADEDLKKFVKRVDGSKKIKCTPLGKCPIDSRANLYRLSELLADYQKYDAVSRRELERISCFLKQKQRLPR